MTTHSSILAWEISQTEEPHRPQSIGSQRVQPNLATKQQQIRQLIQIGGWGGCSLAHSGSPRVNSPCLFTTLIHPSPRATHNHVENPPPVFAYSDHCSTITKRLGGLNSRNSFSHGSGGQKSKINVPEGLVLSENCLLRLQTAPSHCVFTWKETVSRIVSSSCKTSSPMGLRSHPSVFT